MASVRAWLDRNAAHAAGIDPAPAALSCMLRAILLAAVILALAAADADARRRRHHRGYDASPDTSAERYDGDRYNFERRGRDRDRSRAERGEDRRSLAREGLKALVPRDWTLAPPDPQWAGERFISPEGDAWIAIYASPAEPAKLEQHLKEVAFIEGEDITYLRREREWLVVSGFHNDRIFYRKVVLACAEREWRHIALEYPKAEKRAFDRLVAGVARALDFAAVNDCEIARRD